MKNDLLSSGAYGCVFYPSYSCNGKPRYKKTLVSKLTKNNFITETEYSTSQIVKTIPNYKEHFIVVESQCPIVKKDLNESKMKESCEIVKEDKHPEKTKYIILYSKFSKSIELQDYLEVNNTFKVFIRTYFLLSKKINLLIQKKIIHNDLHFSNVLYDLTKGNLLIIDFGLSLQAEKFYLSNGELNMTYLRKVFFNYSPSWNWWSIEFHLLCYIIHNGDIDDKFITDTIDEYLDHHKIIKNISGDFYNTFKTSSFEYFSHSLEGLSVEKKIKFLLSFWNTWDHYKIALHFINIYLQKKMNSPEFMMVLLLLINPNPEYRPSGLELRRHHLLLLKNIPKEHISKRIKET
jgi:serine/threonine protein kinase